MTEMDPCTDWHPWVSLENCVSGLTFFGWKSVRRYDEYTAFIIKLELLVESSSNLCTLTFKEQLCNIKSILSKSLLTQELLAGNYLSFQVLVVGKGSRKELTSPWHFFAAKDFLETVYELTLTRICHSIQPEDVLLGLTIISNKDLV